MRPAGRKALRWLAALGLAVAFTGCERVPHDPPYPDMMRGGLGGPCRGDGTCRRPMQCLEYYGFAGPSGPKLESCEIECDTDVDCPRYARCLTITDGPGRVCRTARAY